MRTPKNQCIPGRRAKIKPQLRVKSLAFALAFACISLLGVLLPLLGSVPANQPEIVFKGIKQIYSPHSHSTGHKVALAPSSFMPQGASGGENATIESDPAVQYGFVFQLPGGKNAFQTLPQIGVSIQNSSLVSQNAFEVRVANLTTWDGPELAATGWAPFDPLDAADVVSLNALFKAFWANSAEGTPISVQTRLNNSTEPMEVVVYRDLSAPSVVGGFELSDGQVMVPSTDRPPLFNQPRPMYFEFTDNILANVTLSILANNQLFKYELDFNQTQFENQSGPFTQVDQVKFLEVETIWGAMVDGNLTLGYYISDNAGNMCPIHFITFVKDTVSPVLDSGIPDRSWLSIGDYAIDTSVEDPIVPIEINERPELHVYMNDNDISSVILRVLNVTADLPANTTISITPEDSSSPRLLTLAPIAVPFAAMLSDSWVFSGRQNGTEWVVEVSEAAWDLLIPGLIRAQIEVSDYAGNISIFQFDIVKLGDGQKAAIPYWRLIEIGFMVAIAAFLLIALRVVRRHQNAIQPYEPAYSPGNPESGTPRDLGSFDPDLIDLVLEPLDRACLSKMLEEFRRGGKNTNFANFTDPEMVSFLSSPMQVIDLREFRLLLSRYHMNPVDFEEFLREMFALSPKERRHFLLKYMEDVRSVPSRKKRVDFLLKKGAKRPKCLKSQPKSPQLSPTDLEKSPDIAIEQACASEGADELGEIDDPWDDFEQPEKPDHI